MTKSTGEKQIYLHLEHKHSFTEYKNKQVAQLKCGPLTTVQIRDLIKFQVLKGSKLKMEGEGFFGNTGNHPPN
jgi:hypothetical protein